MKKALRVGIIGCGGIARSKHIPSLMKLAKVSIVALADPYIATANEAKELFGLTEAEVFQDYRDLLKMDLDAVHICTPNNTHSSISIDAMRAGKDVLCEKPMATTVGEAEAMVTAAEETGRKLSISLQNRFRRDSIVLKQKIDNDELGDIYFAKAHATRRRAVPVWGRFLDKAYQGGGPLIDIGVHALDLTLWLMGNFKPKSVMGSTYKALGSQEGLFNSLGPWDPERFNVEDAGFAYITMENGASVVLEASWALNMLDVKEAKTTLCGTKAGADMNDGLRINGDRQGYLYTEKPDITIEDLEYYDDSQDDPNYNEIKAWIRCLREDTEVPVRPEEALAVTKIIDAVYRSAESGRMIELS